VNAGDAVTGPPRDRPAGALAFNRTARKITSSGTPDPCMPQTFKRDTAPSPMRDMIITIWLADPARSDEATELLTGVLTASEAVTNPSVTPAVDEDDASNRWITVSYDWDPEAAQRINDDFKFDSLVDDASASGLVSALASADIEVVETIEEAN
jgi:hypothetical protein